MKARIINGEQFGGIHTQAWLNNNQNIEIANQLVSEWVLTDILPNPEMKLPSWDGLNWVESYIESIQVPKQLSRMKFEMQVLITTGYEFEDIISFIMGLEMSNLYKKLLVIRLKGCVVLERDSDDLNAVSQMMGITQEQLDEIFIEGNKID